MRSLTFLTLGLLTASAHAELQLAGDPPPPPPPVVVAITPPVVIVTPRAPRPVLSDRWTLTPATGVIWMQLHGATETGMLIQPTLTRTFDRLELQGDYLISNLGDETGAMPRTVMHRIGASAHYQAGRIRVDGKLTLDLVAQGGIGVELLVRDRAGTIERPDISLGIGLRMLTDIDGRANRRILFGMELGVRVIAIPRAAGGPDLGFVVAFGVPLGR